MTRRYETEISGKRYVVTFNDEALVWPRRVMVYIPKRISTGRLTSAYRAAHWRTLWNGERYRSPHVAGLIAQARSALNEANSS